MYVLVSGEIYNYITVVPPYNAPMLQGMGSRGYLAFPLMLSTLIYIRKTARQDLPKQDPRKKKARVRRTRAGLVLWSSCHIAPFHHVSACMSGNQAVFIYSAYLCFFHDRYQGHGDRDGGCRSSGH